ncbi:Protein TolB-like protein [Bienertia sinuspersici]
MDEERGRIAFFTTYRPPVALDIYSCPIQPQNPRKFVREASQKQTENWEKNQKQILQKDPYDERQLTDGKSYNSNAQPIPQKSLKLILQTISKSKPELASAFTEANVDNGGVSGFVFVSERSNDLETLHMALCLGGKPAKTEHVFGVEELFSDSFKGVRMEDSGCFGGEEGDYLVYVTTKDEPPHRRQPWTAKRGGWYGEREKLKTDIFVMNIEKPYNRKLVIKDGGWPTWGSENVIFFHRREGNKPGKNWGVYRADLSNGNIFRVTPEDIDAVTPAAVDADLVAVATIRKKSELKNFTDVREKEQYRQIEVFNSRRLPEIVHITEHIEPLADHFNPFIIEHHDGEKRIGYNRCIKRGTLKSGEDVPPQFDKVQSQDPNIGLFRVSGVFPTFSSDGSKLAFVDNDFKAVWVVDDKPLRKIYQMDDNKVFSPVWNQKEDILYVCFGPSFSAKDNVDICSFTVNSKGNARRRVLTKGFNNAFPSTNPEGTKLVFRSTRDHHGSNKGYKNLYIMKDINRGDHEEGNVERLTNGDWTDTHCKWSPNNDWIVFSSNRDKPENARKGDEDLDSGYFSIYLVSVMKQDVVIRVMTSGSDLSGHVTHPFFSPDGRSIVVTSDVAAISADPMSLPLYLHSARPYGDIFTVDIDTNDISKNKDLETFTRITHSRYENATGTWTKPSSGDPSTQWNNHIKTIPFFSIAPWSFLSANEKIRVASKMSSATAIILLAFPVASIAIVGILLLSAIYRRIERKSK